MKNLLFATLFLSGSLLSGSAIGQKRVDTLVYPNEKVIVETDSNTTYTVARTNFVYNDFWSNWFIAGGGGMQIFFGNEEGLKSFGDRTTGTIEGSFGKWIHPAVGFRAKFGGGPVKSYTTNSLPHQGHSLIVGDPDPQGVYTLQWHQLYGEADAMVDLNNAIGAYKPQRFYSAIPYLGVGIAIVQHQPRHDGDRTAMGIIGLLNRFRITEHFDLNLEIKDAIVKQTYDREVSTRDFESFAALTAGITYNFGVFKKRRFIKNSGVSKTVVERTYRPLLSMQMNETPGQPDTTARQEVIKEVIVEKRHILAHPMAIFFDLDKSDISDRSKVNLAFVADIIKSSEGAKFTLTGSADSRTASARYNKMLSKRRSAAVRDYLVQVMMVDPAQLILDPVGGIDRYSPYPINRVCIIRQEQP